MIGLRLALVMQGLELPSLKRDEGQTLAEYALILALIAVLVIVAVLFLSGQIKGIFSSVGSAL
jgi:Flp pilus assembly pilin Flp